MARVSGRGARQLQRGAAVVHEGVAPPVACPRVAAVIDAGSVGPIYLCVSRFTWTTCTLIIRLSSLFVCLFVLLLPFVHAFFPSLATMDVYILSHPSHTPGSV